MAVTIDRIGSEVADISEAVALLNTNLGDGLYSDAGFLELDTYERAIGLAARDDDGRIIAASVTQALSPDDNGYYDIFGDATHDRLAGHHLASLESIAVATPYRGRGLGKALVNRALQWAVTQQSDLAVAIAWLGPHGAPERPNPSWPLFESLGFEPIAESDEVYTRDSIEGEWACPVDGYPCHCVGRLYVKTL